MKIPSEKPKFEQRIFVKFFPKNLLDGICRLVIIRTYNLLLLERLRIQGKESQWKPIKLS